MKYYYSIIYFTEHCVIGKFNDIIMNAQSFVGYVGEMVALEDIDTLQEVFEVLITK